MNEKLLRNSLLTLLLVFVGIAGAAERVGGPASGDMIRVTVYGQPDLTTQTRVSLENTVTFPFIGEVKVGGITTAQAESNIASALERKGIVKNPQVNVLIEGLSAGELVTVLGHVHQPGRYALGDESSIETRTLLDLLAVAGGTTESANTRVTVFRVAPGNAASEASDVLARPADLPLDVGRLRVEVDLHELMSGGQLGNANLTLRSGDLVIVPEADVFYIYGQVSRPGRYPLLRDMTVMQAISVSGGITQRGAENGLVLTRRENAREQNLNADLTDRIRAGDVLYVKERFF
jgi:polysaccharide export outer membrane protein